MQIPFLHFEQYIDEKLSQRLKYLRKVRVYLLDHILKHYKKNIFSGWDWQTYLLDIAVQLVKTEKEAGIILSLLHTHMHSEYESEQMTKLEYELIRKMKGETSRTG